MCEGVGSVVWGMGGMGDEGRTVETKVEEERRVVETKVADEAAGSVAVGGDGDDWQLVTDDKKRHDVGRRRYSRHVVYCTDAHIG